MKLRDYQQNAIDLARNEYRNGKNSVCLVLPCGAGKSVMAGYIAKQNTDKGKQVMFLVHRIELCEQIRNTFISLGVNMDLCNVLMVQTAIKRLDTYNVPNIIITDEGHHCLSRTYQRIYDYFSKSSKIFFTATPCRLDGKGLGNVCDSLVVGVTAEWLIENGYLAHYDYYAPTLADFSNFKIKRGDYDSNEVTEKLDVKQIYGDVIKHYEKLCKGKKTIAYCSSVQHSLKIRDEFRANGYTAEHIDGTTNKYVRAEIMDKFKNGEIQILCNYEIFGEGLDVPDCEVCLLLRATASLCLYIQMACRCLRYRENKRAIILDFVGNYTRFGLPTIDREWSLDDEIKQHKQYDDDGTVKIRTCLNCYSVFEKSNVCPYCGAKYEFTKQEIQNFKEIELKKIEQAQIQRKLAYEKHIQNTVKLYTSPKQCKSWFELMQWVKLNGYKPQYAYILNKQLKLNYKIGR